MKVLIIGSGAREHAILKQVKLSSRVKKIYCAPGSAAMEDDAECLYIPADNVDMLVTFAKKNQIDLTIVGPELPLTLGVVDAFVSEGLKIFGPTQNASQLEGSKVFAKEFCNKYNIATPDFEIFEDCAGAKAYIDNYHKFPVVIKADGLAAGKGVVIAANREEARKAINDMMLYEVFGQSGRRIVIEQFVTGEEASFIVVSDGKDFVEFPASQDHKPVFDGDKGPNTGGMGAYAPAPLIDAELRKIIIRDIIKPTIQGMAEEKRSYCGFLYAGLMITPEGQPLLLEFNCRLGDPEAEVLLPLLKSDFVDLIVNSLQGKLSQYKPEFHKSSAVCVVLASGGYPGNYKQGFPIQGLVEAEKSNVQVFHAGTKRGENGFVTHGGRVLTVSACDKDLKSAIQHVYLGVEKIQWQGMYYRKDIGKKGLKRLG